MGAKFAKQQILVHGDSQPRQYICLPEEYVYGWIFSIKSDSSELLAYQEDCYHILFTHFHGTITRRAELYTEITQQKKRISELESNLSLNSEYVELLDAKMRYTRLWKNIRETTSDMDDMFISENE